MLTVSATLMLAEFNEGGENFRMNAPTHFASLCLGGAAMAMGDPTATLPTATAAGGFSISVLGGLLAKKNEADAVLRRVRKVHKEAITKAPEHHRGSLRTVETIIEKEAGNCLLNKRALAETAFVGDKFPDQATELILQSLGITQPEHPAHACDFARSILRVGLATAMEKPEFYKSFRLELSLEQAHQIGLIRGDLSEIKDRIEKLTAEVREAYGEEAPAFLLRIAMAFEINNPDASRKQLVALIRDKAEEWKALKQQAEALPIGDERVANIRAAAEDAIERGDFNEARARLDDAIEIEIRDHALVSARKAADMLELKAKSYLLEGDADSAAAAFARAAEMVAPFDKLEGARRNFNSASALDDHGLRYGGTGLQLAIAAYEAVLKVYTKQNHPLDWARTQNNLAIALANQGNRLGGTEGIKLLAKAITSYHAALTVYTEKDHPEDWAMTQNNLANALADQGDRLDGTEQIKLSTKAIAAFETALTVHTEQNHPVRWATTQNNLAAALRQQGSRIGGVEGVELLTKAINAYEAALTIHTKQDHPVSWAMIQNNLAVALVHQGNRLGGAEGPKLLAKAITACEAALTVYTEKDHPVDWATTQNNLANTLGDQGNRLGGAEGINFLIKSVTAYEAALTVRTKQDHPVHWAETNENIALAHKQLAVLDVDKAKLHLQQALHHVDESLTIYDSDHMPYDFGTATKLHDDILAQLAALD